METKKPQVRLENWKLLNDQLVGNVFGHPHFIDGTWVRTSLIVAEHDEGCVIETRNTFYVLGQPGDGSGD